MEIKVDNLKPSGNVEIISSKSFAHRITICAALSELQTGKKTKIIVKGTGEDMEATQRVMKDLAEGRGVLDCGESGSTLRFVLPVCCALGIRESTQFTGRGRLMERPMTPIIEAMEPHGAVIYRQGDRLICKGRLSSGDYIINGGVSSQYISGLLLALPLLEGNSTVTLTGRTASRPYIDMTLEVLKKFAIKISEDKENNIFRIDGGQVYQSPGEIEAEGDWSNGAFWLVGGAIGSRQGITVRGLNPNSSQGDKAVCSILADMGSKLIIKEEYKGKWVIKAQADTLKGIDINAENIPDLVPILAVAAASAHGKTRIFNAGRLRLKESDRLKTVSEMIRALGGSITQGEDYLIIEGAGGLRGGTIDGAGDHRIVMSGAIAAFICKEPVIIKGAEAVNKSYPSFFEERKRICQAHTEKI